MTALRPAFSQIDRTTAEVRGPVTTDPHPPRPAITTASRIWDDTDFYRAQNAISVTLYVSLLALIAVAVAVGLRVLS